MPHYPDIKAHEKTNEELLHTAERFTKRSVVRMLIDAVNPFSTVQAVAGKAIVMLERRRLGLTDDGAPKNWNVRS